MRRTTISRSRLALNCLLAIVVMHGIAGTVAATVSTAHHDLSIRLFPERAELEGRDQIHIRQSESNSLELLLSPRARIQAVRMDGHDHPYGFNRGRLILNPERKASLASMVLSIHYRCRFDDPAPLHPVNTDNPGFGVSGTISASGTFILSGAGWYPRVAGADESFDLAVNGPGDIVAVTSGRLLGINHQGQRTISRWRNDHPLEGLNLSAGPYGVEQRTRDGITAATYFFPDNHHLSPRYLDASLGYLKRYSDLFGAYPFHSFAVVENFFPTGYGFSAYTLMGGMVLRLPFIPETSLPHEIVHNWWGNGVLVDFASGNWCEGLTSYAADYLIQEQTSPDAAMAYRRQALRNYASLVSPAADFPLSHFRSRTDPVTKAVGYDKACMVFHMLRREVGDAAFWEALRNFYRQFLFKRAAWKDLQERFEQHAGRSLDRFFRQWVDRRGAPQMKLATIRRVADSRGYRTIGRLVQEKPYYDVTLELTLDTEDGPVGQAVRLSDRQAEFEIASRTRPHALTADRDYHLFRRLTPQEMPPTVNTLKGSASVVLVIADRLGRLGRPTARHFARAMGINPIRTLRETEFSPADVAGNDLLFIGLPENPQALHLLPRDLALAPTAFEIGQQPFGQPADVLFLVARHPDHSETIVSLLHPLSADAADQASLKIPHYGRYSYLAFSNGDNRVKGTWEVNTSPMIVRWDPDNTP